MLSTLSQNSSSSSDVYGGASSSQVWTLRKCLIAFQYVHFFRCFTDKRRKNHSKRFAFRSVVDLRYIYHCNLTTA